MNKKRRLSILVFAIISCASHSISATDKGITDKLTKEVNLKISEQINALLEVTIMHMAQSIELNNQQQLK